MAAIPKPKHTITAAIYAMHERVRDNEPRPYLGASVIGAECERALWYSFRWTHSLEELSGRKLRLFETGHREEVRLIAELRAVGCVIEGEQTGFVAIGGHFRGHMDGLVHGLPEAPTAIHVLEVKTHNDKSYSDLWRQHVQKSKPQHYAQMQIYMHYMDLERALYLAVNKNDDTLYSERVRYDAAKAASLLARAERIIRAQRPPPKLHEDPSARAAFACGWCPAKEVCHENSFTPRNCRTCLSSTPVVPATPITGIDDTAGDEEGVWRCDFWKKNLTLKEQRAGCPEHRYLPGLVPGTQTDATEISTETNLRVTYTLAASGKEWIDGV